MEQVRRPPSTNKRAQSENTDGTSVIKYKGNKRRLSALLLLLHKAASEHPGSLSASLKQTLAPRVLALAATLK